MAWTSPGGAPRTRGRCRWSRPSPRRCRRSGPRRRRAAGRRSRPTGSTELSTRIVTAPRLRRRPRLHGVRPAEALGAGRTAAATDRPGEQRRGRRSVGALATTMSSQDGRRLRGEPRRKRTRSSGCSSATHDAPTPRRWPARRAGCPSPRSVLPVWPAASGSTAARSSRRACQPASQPMARILSRSASAAPNRALHARRALLDQPRHARARHGVTAGRPWAVRPIGRPSASRSSWCAPGRAGRSGGARPARRRAGGSRRSPRRRPA